MVARPIPVGSCVDFHVAADVVFDYLADPVNRPEWQSSLRRVVDVDPGPPHIGQRWTDVTAVGIRPRMETVRADRPRSWAEAGEWRFVTARLGLRFEPTPDGCAVHADFALSGPAFVRPALWLLTRVAGPAVRADLRRAARVLSARGAGH